MIVVSSCLSAPSGRLSSCFYSLFKQHDKQHDKLLVTTLVPHTALAAEFLFSAGHLLSVSAEA